MHILKISTSLLLTVIALFTMGCATPEPLPTYTPFPTQTPLPTHTPFPTQTPLPTHTPFPTWTPAPVATATLTPTVTPQSTATPRPTRTRIPTITARPSATPQPTATPIPWETYQHNRDGDSDNCDNHNNFAIDIPPTWVQKFTSCGNANFESRDGNTEIQITSMHAPNYSSNPSTALEEIAEDYGKDYTTQGIGGQVIEIVVTRTEKIQHQGETALSQRLTETPEFAFIYCVARTDRIIVLSMSWATHIQRALFVAATRCQNNTSHDADIKRALGSFQLIEPY